MVKVYPWRQLGNAITPEVITQPAARKVLLISTANSALKEAQQQGHFKPDEFTTIVDGRPNRFVQRVRAGGRVSFADTQSNFVAQAFTFTRRRLLSYSPTKTGRYKSSFKAFALPTGAPTTGGRPINFPSQIQGDEVFIVQTQPYGAKIERTGGGVFRHVYRELVAQYGSNISVSFFYAQGFATYKGRFYAAPAIRIGRAGAFSTRASNPNSAKNKRRR